MKRIAVSFVLLVSCLLLAAASSGCLALAAAGAAGTGVAYARGDLAATVAASPEQTMQAARSALNDLGIPITSYQASDLDGEILARTARDDRVKITAKVQGPNATKLSIRIGTFGDRQRSLAIYDAMKPYLPETD